MIGEHLQNNSDHWPRTIEYYWPGTPLKAVTGVERLREAKSVAETYNTNVFTVYRYHIHEQPFADSTDYIAHIPNVIAFFSAHIDGTFDTLAQHVDAVSEYNEYMANSHTQYERDVRMAWLEAVCFVWQRDYHFRYPHIRVMLCAVAVGNDVSDVNRYIDLHRRYGNFAVHDHHAYIPVKKQNPTVLPSLGRSPAAGYEHHAIKESFTGNEYPMNLVVNDSNRRSLLSVIEEQPSFIMPGEFEWYSGRFVTLYNQGLAQGVRIKMFSGEFGVVRDASNDWSGHLDPQGGWRHPDALSGNIELLKEAYRYWILRIVDTEMFKNGDYIGATKFTTGGGNTWQHFNISYPQTAEMAQFVFGLMQSVELPDPDPNPCVPRVPYSKTSYVVPQNTTFERYMQIAEAAYSNKRSLIYSYDDGGFGAGILPDVSVVLWDIPIESQHVFIEWYADHYPGTKVEFRSTIVEPLRIIDIVDDLPKHPTRRYRERPLDGVTICAVHHSVTPNDRQDLAMVETIARYHTNRTNELGEDIGWPGIGYQYVVLANGTVYKVNKPETMSYHAGHLNDKSVGVCLLGDFTHNPPTEDAITGSRRLITEILPEIFPNLSLVSGHRQLDGHATQCPGNTWEDWLHKLT